MHIEEAAKTRKELGHPNRLLTQTDALDKVTSYSYDGRDNLRTITDARGNTTTYHYDGLDQLHTRESPDTGTTYSYSG